MDAPISPQPEFIHFKSNQVNLLYLIVFTSLCIETRLEDRTGNQLVILNFRQASNDALRSLDTQKELPFMTENMMITLGKGTLLQETNKSERTLPRCRQKEFTGFEYLMKLKLTPPSAWRGKAEPGRDTNLMLGKTVAGGICSAYWIRQYGICKINSELFVRLH